MKGNESMSVTNSNLHNAKRIKNDEFYTQIADVSKEVAYYKSQFRNKTVFCNCDNPDVSAFWEYFHLNFEELKLRKLVSTYYNKNGNSYKSEYVGGNDKDIRVGIKSKLKENGDFRNQECIELLDKCDIVVTNPPFSLFREYVSILMEHKKVFLIVGNKNAITYKDFFKLLKDGKVWIGYTNIRGFLQPNGSIKKFGNIGWFTNIETEKRYEELILQEKYTPEKYLKYDNYCAININKVSEIPCDYSGIMGVPITFLDKFNPKQFEILGYAGGIEWDKYNEIKTLKKYIDCKQHNPDGTVTNGGKINTGATLRFENIPAERYYTASNCSGYLLRTYGRILIRKLNRKE